MADLTPIQFAVLRACPEQPGARFPSTDAEVLVLDGLSVLGLVRRMRYYRRDPVTRERVPGYCWQRTEAGTDVAEPSAANGE